HRRRDEPARWWRVGRHGPAGREEGRGRDRRLILPARLSRTSRSSRAARSCPWHVGCTSIGPGGERQMADLTTKKREGLRSNQFAYVDTKGGEHLPIHDESHIRNAMARWNQTEFESAAAKERARKKIVSAAKRHGIEVEDDSKVAKPSRTLRAASTKKGPRGGRKKS